MRVNLPVNGFGMKLSSVPLEITLYRITETYWDCGKATVDLKLTKLAQCTLCIQHSVSSSSYKGNFSVVGL